MTQKVGFEEEIKTFNRGLILASPVVVAAAIEFCVVFMAVVVVVVVVVVATCFHWDQMF